MKAVDLMDFNTEEKADKGVDIEIFDPRGGDTGIIITMMGSDSAAYLDADRKIKNRNLELAKRKKDFTVGMSPEEIDAAAVERMKACFVGWKQQTGTDDAGEAIYKESLLIGGQWLPSTKQAFGDLMSRRGFFFIRQQVAEGMDKVTNFLPTPQTSSAPLPSSASSMTPQENPAQA